MTTPMLHLSMLILAAAPIFCMSGCKAPSHSSNAPADALYAASPQQAVETATTLLRSKDWAKLARYYDLTGSSLSRADLANGAFFYSDRVEGLQHPAGLSKYKHPFAPGFKFMRAEPTADKDVVKVWVAIEIDQGGGPPQRGVSAFLMRKSPRGYQFLPTAVDA